MKLDVAMLTHDLRTVPDYARKVEALGFDCLWSAETQHDPFLPLAAVGGVIVGMLFIVAAVTGRPRNWRAPGAPRH